VVYLALTVATVYVLRRLARAPLSPQEPAEEAVR
jgi:cytochrome d ubiquinol oxidase subunit I